MVVELGEYWAWPKMLCTIFTQLAGALSWWRCHLPDAFKIWPLPTTSIPQTPQHVTVVVTDQVEYTHNEQYPCSWGKLSTISSYCLNSFLLTSRGWGLLQRRPSLGFGFIATDPRVITCFDRFQKVLCGVLRRPHSTHYHFKHCYEQRKWARTLYISVHTRQGSRCICAKPLHSTYISPVNLDIPILFDQASCIKLNQRKYFIQFMVWC